MITTYVVLISKAACSVKIRGGKVKRTIAIVVCRNKTQADKARGKIRKLLRQEGEMGWVVDLDTNIRGTLHTFKVRIRERGLKRRQVLGTILGVAKRLESIDDWSFTTW